MSPRPDSCFPASLARHRDNTPRAIIPPLPPDSCSVYTDENLPGTAAREELWVLLEHPGNWGHDIFDGHAFEGEASIKLKQKIVDAGARLLLIRRPGREGQLAKITGEFTAFIADTKRNQLFTFTVQEPSDLLGLPLDRPSLIPGVKRSNQVLMLLCTHAKRDRCCALRGRPIAGFLAEKLAPHTVWECSHTGGHRFAPVGLLMPSGYTYGRLSPESALTTVQFMADRGIPATTGLRGRSSLTPPEQAAEFYVRRALEEAGEVAGIDELTITAHRNNLGATVTHSDGRRWSISLRQKQLPPRPNSCGKTETPAKSWMLESLEQVL